MLDCGRCLGANVTTRLRGLFRAKRIGVWQCTGGGRGGPRVKGSAAPVATARLRFLVPVSVDIGRVCVAFAFGPGLLMG